MDKEGFVSMIGLLLALIIIIFIFYMTMNAYLKGGSVSGGKDAGLVGLDSGAAGYKGILDNTKSRVRDINKQTQGRSQGY